MIALKLVFQSLAGAGSVLACLGGGYYITKQNIEEDFYLVSSETTPSSTPSSDLWVAPTKVTAPASTPSAEEKTEKNYKCWTGDSANIKEDSDCFLYSLTPKTSKTAIKSSDIQTFITNTNATSTVVTKTTAKATITAKKFFLLKADKKLYTTWTFDGQTTIKLVEKSATSSDTDKTYATFQVHAKISSSEVEGKTSFAIVKYLKDEPSTISIAANATVTCKLTGTATAEDCFITEITDPSSPTDLEKIVFTSITNPATQQTSLSITKDKHYLIQFKTPKTHSLEELAAKVIIVVSPTAGGTGDSSTSTELKVQTPAFIQPPTSGAITEAIIIK